MVDPLVQKQEAEEGEEEQECSFGYSKGLLVCCKDAVNTTNHKFKMAQNFLNFLPEIHPHVFEIPDKCNHRRLHPVPIPK